MSAPYIPATALGGDLVRDWTGPTDEWVPPGATSFSGRWAPSVVLDGHPYPDRYRVQVRLRLDPRREEVATRIATVLRRKGHEVGHLLPVALGGRQGDVIAEVPCACGGQGVEVGPDARGCADCGLRGTVRTLIPATDVSAALLAASVAGVEAGLGVVRGVLFHGDYNIWRDDDGTVEFPPGEQPTALAAGYAYLSPAAPFGVVVPFLRDGREVGS